MVVFPLSRIVTCPPKNSPRVCRGACHFNSLGCPVQAPLGAGPLGGRMLPYYWKDTCLLSAPRGPLRLDFYPLRLLPARAKGSGQECPLYTSASSGPATNPRVTGFR